MDMVWCGAVVNVVQSSLTRLEFMQNSDHGLSLLEAVHISDSSCFDAVTSSPAQRLLEQGGVWAGCEQFRHSTRRARMLDRPGVAGEYLLGRSESGKQRALQRWRDARNEGESKPGLGVTARCVLRIGGVHGGQEGSGGCPINGAGSRLADFCGKRKRGRSPLFLSAAERVTAL